MDFVNIDFPEPEQFNGSDNRDWIDDYEPEDERPDLCQCGTMILLAGEDLCPDCARGAAIRSAEGV